MNYYVYILTNKHGTVLYTGVTRDLVRRVYEHKNHVDKDSFTAKYNVTKLVYFEQTNDVRSAIEREKQLKGWTRAKKNWLIAKANPSWNLQKGETVNQFEFNPPDVTQKFYVKVGTSAVFLSSTKSLDLDFYTLD